MDRLMAITFSILPKVSLGNCKPFKFIVDRSSYIMVINSSESIMILICSTTFCERKDSTFTFNVLWEKRFNVYIQRSMREKIQRLHSTFYERNNSTFTFNVLWEKQLNIYVQLSMRETTQRLHSTFYKRNNSTFTFNFQHSMKEITQHLPFNIL